MVTKKFKLLMIYFISITLTFIFWYLVTSYFTSGYLVILGFFGLTAYFLIDLQDWFKVSVLVKSIIAIIINVAYRLYDLNDYQHDQRSFEYYQNGELVTHSSNVDTFKFLEFYDLVLLLLLTFMMISIYELLKNLNSRKHKQ